jgi:hypothetical protein
MKARPILKELRATRDQLAAEAGGDMRKLLSIVRREAKSVRAKGTRTVPEPSALPATALREDPPPCLADRKPPNPILAEIRTIRDELSAEMAADPKAFLKKIRKMEQERKEKA